MNYEDIVLEMALLERQSLKRIAEKMASQQLGLAWLDLVDDRETVEGGEVEAA
jgi:hypothetical protein